MIVFVGRGGGRGGKGEGDRGGVGGLGGNDVTREGSRLVVGLFGRLLTCGAVKYQTGRSGKQAGGQKCGQEDSVEEVDNRMMVHAKVIGSMFLKWHQIQELRI